MPKFIAYLILLTFGTSQTFAQVPGFTMPGGQASLGGAEFFVGRIEGKPLITVNLLSGVRAPGVYHIPIQTNLSQLFSYSGGLSENAEVSKIAVRSPALDGKSETVAHYDWDNLVDRKEGFPILKDKDIVTIDTKPNTLANTALWVGILSGITSIILGVIVISNNTKK